MSASIAQTHIEREQRRAEHLRQCQVHAIVRRHKMPHLPNPGKKQFMPIPGYVQFREILQRFRRSSGQQLTSGSIASENLSYLNVEKVGGMKRF